MTIERATHFQNDLRELFKKYGINSGFAMFMHNETLHPVEAHVNEKNQFIVGLINSLTEAAKAAMDVPVTEHWNTDNN